MKSFILRAQDTLIKIKAGRRDLQQLILDTFLFASLLPSDSDLMTDIDFTINLYDARELPSYCNNKKGVKIIEQFTEKLGKIKCWKNKSYIFYNIADKYILIGEPYKKTYRFYLGEKKHWLPLLMVSLILHYQYHKSYYGLHAGLFEYKDLNFLVIGGGGSGKTTFLVNLVLSNIGINYICDDLCIIFERNNQVCCRGILNTLKYALEDYYNKKTSNDDSSCADAFISFGFKDYRVDRIIFVNITGKDYTKVEFLPSENIFFELMPALILTNILPKDKLEILFIILKKLIEQTQAYVINLGKDIRLSPDKTAYTFRLVLNEERKRK